MLLYNYLQEYTQQLFFKYNNVITFIPILIFYPFVISLWYVGNYQKEQLKSKKK